MLKIVYKVLIKKNREKEFKKLSAKVLLPQARIIKGCLQFLIFENPNNQRELIFYEIWGNDASVQRYYRNLYRVLGKNSPGKVFPDKLNDFIEEDEDILHQKIR